MKKSRIRWNLHFLKQALVPGFFLSIHFITWALGGRMIPSANAVMVVNLAPAVMPLVAWFIAGDRPRAGEIAGTIIGLAGVFFLTSSDFHLDRKYFGGDLVCLFSMILFTVYLSLGRRLRDTFPHIVLYLVPLYALGCLFGLCFWVVAQFWHGMPFPILWQPQGDLSNIPREVLILVGVALIPTVLGHGITNWSVRRFSAQTVSLVNLSQFIFAGFFAWVLWREIPKANFFLAAVLICVGLVIALESERRRTKILSAQTEK
jgi:drug/metabolite transporter (DMT)-like permease